MEPEQDLTRENPLLDSEGLHDIPLPPRGWFRMRRRIVAFLDDSIEQLVADLPDWGFETREVSNSVYRVTATNSLGHRIELTGSDMNDLHKQAAEAAKSIEDQCRNKN